MAESGGAGKERFGICMRREGPLGGDCLVCVMPADSQQAGSRNSPAREGDLYPIDRRLPPHKYLLPALRLQQVRILQNVSIEQQIAILSSIITPFWEDDQRSRAAFCPQVFSL